MSVEVVIFELGVGPIGILVVVDRDVLLQGVRDVAACPFAASDFAGESYASSRCEGTILRGLEVGLAHPGLRLQVHVDPPPPRVRPFGDSKGAGLLLHGVD